MNDQKGEGGDRKKREETKEAGTVQPPNHRTSDSAYPTLYIAHVTAEYFDQIWFLFGAVNSHKRTAASSNESSGPRFIEERRLTRRRKVQILDVVTARALFNKSSRSISILT